MENGTQSISYPVKNSPNYVSTVVHADVERVMAVLMERDVSPHTRLALVTDIRHFIEWWSGYAGEEFTFQRVVQREVIAMRDAMKAAGRKPGTINRRLINVRLFLKTAVDLGIIPKSPADGVKQLNMQSLAPKSLTAQEARRFLKEVELRGSLRDTLVVHLMLSAGLRSSEVIALTLQDIELSERRGVLHVRHAKGNKSREVPANALLRDLLTRYIDQYKREGVLLVGQRGRLTQWALAKIIGKYAAKAGLKVSPHTMRHTFSYQYLQQHPGEIVGLAAILGHSSVNTTAIYTQHRFDDLQTKVEQVSF